MKIQDGSGWARAGVALGALLSITGNATHVVLTDSPVSLWIRIPQAVALPVILFVAVEIFVRTAWRAARLDWFGRAVLVLFPSIGAAYVSFRHLQDLSYLSDHDVFTSYAWPVAIDGLMLGSTVALLAIRAAALARVQTPVLDEWDTAMGELVATQPKPPAVAPTSPAVSPARTPRGEVPQAHRDVVRELISGQAPAAREGAQRATIGRYAKVWRTLKIHPGAEIDHAREKVRPELVDELRTAARLEIERMEAVR